MATAEELLNSISKNQVSVLSEDDGIFVIDAESRTITVPDSERLFGVEGDKDVERKYFQCPKIVGDNIDLSQHQIYVSYVFTTTENNTIFPTIGNGLYHCEDVEVSGDNITFSWLLSGNVFANPGFIAFKVMAKKSEGSELKTKWNTAPAIGTVLLTVPDGEEIAEEYPDIINQLLTKMESVEQIATPEAMQGYVNAYLEENPVTGGMTEEQEQQLNKNTEDISSLSEDIVNIYKNNEIVKTFRQTKTSEYDVDIVPGEYTVKTLNLYTTVVLYNTDEYSPTEASNYIVWDNNTVYKEKLVKIDLPYKHLHIWQGKTNEEVSVSFESFGTLLSNTYGKKLYEIKATANARSYNNLGSLTSGKNIIFVIDGVVDNCFITLDTNVEYNANSTSKLTILKNKYNAEYHSTPVYKLDTDYKSIRVFNNSPIVICIYEVTEDDYERDNKVVEIYPNWTQNLFYENGENSNVQHTDAISTQKLFENGMYLITFPDELTATFNVKQYNNKTERMNVNSYHPFSVFCSGDDFLRVAFKRKDNQELLPSSSIVSSIRIYLIRHAKTQYDISIAPSDSAMTNKKKADIVLDGKIDTRFLCAVFGCYNSVNAYLYSGTYNISELYTYTDTAKISIPFNSYNFDGGTGYRRYITVTGEHVTSPQDCFGGVNFVVTEGLHNSLKNNGVNYFLIGTPYAVSDEPIQRMATSCNISNINIIGYGYDKPITYVDTTRCLSTMLECVNVRSWSKNICGYDPFETTPNEECCGIRVGRGSNYGIQNYVKHLNVWYCGKGIACNGEHFIFEDVKTHHDYIGFVFGDRKTFGKQEHPNILIGCSIEGCYRLMLLTKSGVKTDESGNSSLPESTLIIIGMSTEALWSIPQNEVVDGKTSQLTLPIKELVKNVWRGRIEIDWTGDVFENGSGTNFVVTQY